MILFNMQLRIKTKPRSHSKHCFTVFDLVAIFACLLAYLGDMWILKMPFRMFSPGTCVWSWGAFRKWTAKLLPAPCLESCEKIQKPERSFSPWSRIKQQQLVAPCGFGVQTTTICQNIIALCMKPDFQSLSRLERKKKMTISQLCSCFLVTL